MNKGHFLPTQKMDVIEYAETILTFMIKGPAALPVLDEADFVIEETLANRFYPSATVEERFCAYSYELSQLHHHTINDIEQHWVEQYQPLFYISFSLKVW